MVKQLCAPGANPPSRLAGHAGPKLPARSERRREPAVSLIDREEPGGCQGCTCMAAGAAAACGCAACMQGCSRAELLTGSSAACQAVAALPALAASSDSPSPKQGRFAAASYNLHTRQALSKSCSGGGSQVAHCRLLTAMPWQCGVCLRQHEARRSDGPDVFISTAVDCSSLSCVPRQSGKVCWAPKVSGLADHA